MNVECLVVLESKEVFCKEYANVFVFLCCVTNNHKSSGLKQKSRRAQLDSLLKVSECWNQGGSKLGLLSEGSEEEPAAGLIQVVGWIQSMQLEDCGPCFLPGCWLRVVLFFCFFFLFVCLFVFPASRDSLYFLALGRLHFTNPAMTNWINLLLWMSSTSSPFYSAFLFCHQLEKGLCFNNLCDFTQQIRIIQDHLPLLKSTDWVLHYIWKKSPYSNTKISILLKDRNLEGNIFKILPNTLDMSKAHESIPKSF